MPHDGVEPTLSLAGMADDVTSLKRVDRTLLAEKLRTLSHLSPTRPMVAILVQWIVILGIGYAAIASERWYVYVLAAIVIATRQHALGTLVHEGVHYRLFNNRILNDGISDVFCALPIGISTSVYRHNHFRHHRFVNSDNDPDLQSVKGDPDWLWPKTILGCISVFLRDIVGINCRMIGRYILAWSPYPRMHLSSTNSHSSLDDGPRLSLREKLFVVAWVACLALTLTFVNGFWKYYLLLWIVPQFTLLTAIFRIRALAEHYCIERTDELTQARTVLPHLIERFLITPCNVNYHLEHHMFPSVPFYNLPALHRLLMTSSDVYEREACITSGYLFGKRSLLAQLLGRASSR